MKSNKIEIGTKYGNYTVISLPFSEGKYKKIQIQCKCGYVRNENCGSLNKLNKCKKCIAKEKYRKYKAGDKKHSLTIIEYLYVNNKYHSTKLKVRCDCGEHRYINTSEFGKNKTCGCNKFESGKNHYSFQGYNNISKTKYNYILQNAKKRKFDFDISMEYLDALLIKQNFKCALTGIKIALTNKLSSASLDRIDSKKGYIEGNLQWVHKDVNRMKSDFEEQYFKKLCELITNYKG